MKKIIISMLVITFILILVISFTIVSSFSSKGNYVKIQEYNHSLTKAICNSENFCQDYEILCKEEKVVRISPITGAAVQFSENWQDLRDEESLEKPC